MQAILATNDPKQQKVLGRQTKGYNDVVWEAVGFMVMELGLILKFTQNKELGWGK